MRRLGSALLLLSALPSGCGGRVWERPGDAAAVIPLSSQDAESASERDASSSDPSNGTPEGGTNADANVGAITAMATSFLVNPAHTNAVDDPSLAPPLALLWSQDSLADGYPLIAQGLVFLLSDSSFSSSAGSTLVALDAMTGTTAWGPSSLDSGSPTGQAYDGGRVFVASSDGGVFAFDATTGALLWTTSFSGGSPPGAPPTAYGGILYVPLAGELVALDESDGETLWSAILDGGEVSAPAVTDEGVFVSADCDSIYAFDPRSGAALWHVGPLCDGGDAPDLAVFQGRVYFQAADSGPTILDAATGANVGTFTCVTSPAFYGARGFFNERTPLYGVDLPANQNAWSFSGDGSLNLTPIVVGGAAGATVYVQSDSGKLFGVDADSGAPVWSTQARNLGAPGALAAGSGILLALGNDGYPGIFAYGHVDEPDAGVGFGVAPDGGPLAPVVLASGESGPQSLALDTSDVYWTAYGAGEIRKVSKDGGSPSTVASQASTNPYGLAVGAGHVYWTAPNFYVGGTGAAVMAQSLDGGAPFSIATGVTGPTSIAVGPGDVYWIEEDPGEVVAAPLLASGAVGGSISIASGGTASALVVGPRQVFWSAADATYQAALDGSSPTAIGPPATAIAIDETDVYLAIDTTWSGVGTILRVPIGGGTPTTLATGRTGSVVAIAVDASNVYWVEGEGTIQQGAVAAMPKGGGYVSILAAGLGDPSAVAVDDTGIYFTNPSGGGNIEKVPRAP